ncbi:Ig-like domain-containing protein [Pleionea mediterranea]|uniref:PGAP1-like protein n=1 Tax=Pleionea mediterranea TaxID=523701 RepID=A0A316FF94_9GAMM|nr:Ig-like domain-containing protein [Pleionea mediterranea]PWK46356.1 PGAP1-like protein [Pleionea mediterranea]
MNNLKYLLLTINLFLIANLSATPNPNRTIHIAGLGMGHCNIGGILDTGIPPVFQTYSRNLIKTGEMTLGDAINYCGHPNIEYGTSAKIILGSDNIFDRPVFIIEGYDPYNQENLNSYWNNYGLSSVGNDLLSAGNDLVFINFKDSSTALEDNSFNLQLLINYIGNEINNSNHNMSVLGFSMGGVIARMALANMEKINADHNVSLYISYDAPHRGANAPIDIIKQINHIEDKVDITGCGLSSKCRDVRNKLRYEQVRWKSMAARQMLITGDKSKEFYSNLHNNIGYPSNLRLVAFSNGSGNGIKLPNLYDGKEIMRYTVDYKGILQGNNATYQLKSHDLDNDYKGYFNYSSKYFDKAPGGTSDSFYKISDKLSNQDKIYMHYYSGDRNHSFVPTVSALDLHTTDLNASTESYYTPFDKIYHAGNNNYSHTSIIHHKDNILNELNNNIAIDEPSNINPIAKFDSITLETYGSSLLNLVANDIDSNGDNLTIESFTQPANAIITQISDSSVKIEAKRYPLTSTFTYIINDGNGGTSSAEVEVNLLPPINECRINNRDYICRINEQIH